MKCPAFIAGFILACGLLTAGLEAVEPASSPFANKPADSYSNYIGSDGKTVYPLWGDLKPLDFGSRTVTFDQTGIRHVRQIPAPGVHPRICFTPDDLPDIRWRLKETRAGQEAWKNILSWTEMMKGNYDDKAPYAQPDTWNGGYGGLHGRVPLFRLGVPRIQGAAYNHHPLAAAIYNGLADGTAKEFPAYYWNVFSLEAFRCLVENDRPGAEKLARASVTALRLDQSKRAAERIAKQAKKPGQPLPPPEQPVGAFQLAFTYDFLFAWLTSAQRQAMHDELAVASWSHDNYGTFNGAEGSRSNWATFSYWLFEVLAIEGEPGFNDLKVRGMYRGWRNLLTYGWFQSGATYEGEAKNQLGMDGVLMFAMREKAYGFDNLAAHPYLRAYATKFLPQSINPMLDGFHKYDLLGGSRNKGSGFSSNDAVGLKFLFPDDPAIDWVYRKAIGENYENVPTRPDGYYNALLFFAVNATDFNPANNDPARLNLGNTFFCPERALLMTRSDWSKDAVQLNLHVRQANGGHPFADRNAIMVAGAGRIWSPNGYASFRTDQNSVVCIDGQTQHETVAGRLVDYADSPSATFATGDAKYPWDWRWRTLDNRKGTYTAAMVRADQVEVPAGWELEKHTTNDFSFLKLPYAYLDIPLSETIHWIQPAGAVRPLARQPNYPVQKAYRTAGLIRGDHPYILVIDDIKKDDTIHHYDWTLALENDIQIVKVTQTNAHELDVILTGFDPDQSQPRSKEALTATLAPDTAIPAGQPMLLVRVLNRTIDSQTAGTTPKIEEQPASGAKYQPLRVLKIPADAVSPDFKVLLYPYRQGAPLPTTFWDARRTAVRVNFGATKDVITFTPGSLGKTNIAITRDGAPLINVDREIKPFK